MSTQVLDGLPGWEMPVLQGVSQGLSDVQIGAQLYLSRHTVKTYTRRLYRRVGALNRAHAVRIGFERGWLSPSNTEHQPVELAHGDLAVLDLVSRGATYPRIGAQLGISGGAAKERARGVFRALGAAGKAHAVRRGFELSLLPTSS